MITGIILKKMEPHKQVGLNHQLVGGITLIMMVNHGPAGKISTISGITLMRLMHRLILVGTKVLQVFGTI